MSIQDFIQPFEWFFTSDLCKYMIYLTFLPFVFVVCCIYLIKEILTR